MDDAIEFCKRRVKNYPDQSFYRFWLDRLNRGKVNTKIRLAQCSTRPAKSSDPAVIANPLDTMSMTREIRERFAGFRYNLGESKSAEISPKRLQQVRAELASALPFKGEIYLPTNKIPLKEQVAGLRDVASLVQPENKAVTKARWNALKEILRKRGRKRVFIVGNGPSLKRTDLDLLADEITIGFNGIFLHETFVPTIYVVEDHLVAEDRAREIADFECPVKVFPSYLGYCIPPQENTIYLNHLPRSSFPVDTDFSDNAGDITYTGGTVTYTGMVELNSGDSILNSFRAAPNAPTPPQIG
ncbi:hypothetical protein [Thiorhodovibrio winogradskyi]|uniref:hypothetical protein n=1 Tax=Thiorhodovibrio winogradskyi TaxID=77007 RepID=UPI002E27F317|nr:hypothetical protein [Thiorhodovibrio winogradskyi]